MPQFQRTPPGRMLLLGWLTIAAALAAAFIVISMLMPGA